MRLIRVRCVRGGISEFEIGSLGWDVVVNICAGFLHTGSQVTSLRNAAIELFSTSEIYMWVKTQSVCVEQRQELAWNLQQA